MLKILVLKMLMLKKNYKWKLSLFGKDDTKQAKRLNALMLI